MERTRSEGLPHLGKAYFCGINGCCEAFDTAEALGAHHIVHIYRLSVTRDELELLIDGVWRLNGEHDGMMYDRQDVIALAQKLEAMT